MAALSIIIPVFNKVAYVDSCLSSILDQTFQDFEILLINDGSTDGSAAKCDHYASLDSRVKVWHQDNQGVSAARNLGLDKATGKFIGFVDSDDIIENDMFETLINNALKTGAEISACGMAVFYPDKTSLQPAEAQIRLLDNSEGISWLLKGKLYWSANNKIYISALAKQLKFEGAINEDVLFNFHAFIKAESTVFQDVIKYKYMVRSNSVSMSKFGPKYMQTIAVSKEIVDFVSKNMPAHLDEAKALDFSKNISLFNLLLLANRNLYQKEYDLVLNNLKSYSDFSRNSPYIPRKQRLAYLALTASPRIYSGLLKLYCSLSNSDVTKRT